MLVHYVQEPCDFVCGSERSRHLRRACGNLNPMDRPGQRGSCASSRSTIGARQLVVRWTSSSAIASISTPKATAQPQARAWVASVPSPCLARTPALPRHRNPSRRRQDREAGSPAHTSPQSLIPARRPVDDEHRRPAQDRPLWTQNHTLTDRCQGLQFASVRPRMIPQEPLGGSLSRADPKTSKLQSRQDHIPTPAGRLARPPASPLRILGTARRLRTSKRRSYRQGLV